MIAGYLAGVVAALVSFAVALWFQIGATPDDSSAAGMAFGAFVILIVLHWLVALVPFLVLRKFGGFDNAWFSTFVGGVLTALLVFPFPVWLYVTLINIEGNLSYFSTLGTVADHNWPLIIMSGALGGLTYAGVKRASDRLARASNREIGEAPGS